MTRSIRVLALALIGTFGALVPGRSAAAQVKGFYHKGHRPASCENHEAWNAYKRDLDVVTGMFKDADAENARALAEFDSAADEIDRTMMQGFGRQFAKEDLELSSADRENAEAVERLEHEVSLRLGRGETETIEKLYEEFDTETAAMQEEAWTEFIAFQLPEKLLEAGEWGDEAHEAVENLDRSERSQARMLRQADDKWRQVLDDLRRATAQDAKCAADVKQLEREAQLERAARDYIENLEMGYHRADGSWQRQWVIGNRAYNDYESAIKAAERHLSGQSSLSIPLADAVFRYAAYGSVAGGQRADTLRLSRADVRRVHVLLREAVRAARIVAAADTRLVDLYTRQWRSTREWTRRVSRPR